MEPVAFGTWTAIRFCDARQAAKSSREEVRSRAAKARARRSARIGCARQYELIARRGVGGIKGW